MSPGARRPRPTCKHVSGRRASLPIAAALAAVVAFCALSLSVQGCRKGDERPSVIIIIIDTLRADYVGCYGSPDAATPNIDRLATQGARFSQCITAAPVTLPSISTILTSTYPTYHGVRDNGIFKLDPSLVTLAEVFEEAGYATAAVVGAGVIGKGTGIEQGFDHFDADFSGDYARESSLSPAEASEFALTQRRADEVTRLATAWLARSRGPFCLVAHYFDPHAPYDPPPEYGARYSSSAYLGEVAFADSRLGPLLDAARQAASDNGLITALVADHGEGLGEHGEEQHGFFIYDSTVRVPFVVSYPPLVAAGVEIGRQVSTADLAPTVLDLAGIAAPESWQGRSLAAAIAARRPAERGSMETTPLACYMETYRTRYSYSWSELTGIRYNGWKLVRAPKPELYDLEGDPAETRNLYSSDPGRARAMESRLDELWAALRGPFADLKPTVDLDESEIQKLKTLGYVMPEKAPPPGPLPDPKDMIVRLRTRFEASRLAEEARRMLAAGDAAGAEEKLHEALERNPESAVALHDLGLLYWGRGRKEEGLSLLERAASLDASTSAPHTNLGIAYMTLGRYAEAAREFERSVALDPGDAEARYKYGKALEMSGDRSAALEQYFECLARRPGMRDALYDAAVILARTGRPGEARPLLERLLADNAGDQYARSAKALLRQLP
jgi:arylsulfatase A-like enzyme/Flp pilus assembly protein TadD